MFYQKYSMFDKALQCGNYFQDLNQTRLETHNTLN